MSPKAKVIAVKVVGTIFSIFAAGLAVKYPDYKAELIMACGVISGWLHLPQPQVKEEKKSDETLS